VIVCDTCHQTIRAVEGLVNPRVAQLDFVAGCGHYISAEEARTAYRQGAHVVVPTINGATLIGAERTRQHAEEGHTGHADAALESGELAWSAWALLDRVGVPDDGAAAGPPMMWPLPAERWPGDKSALRLLIIAGAFIAAEIDRRLANGERP
jgi:hypothetical protein